MNDNYKIFGFKNNQSYNDFLNIMKEMVLYERKKAGFCDDVKTEFNADTMIEKTLELEIYNNLNKHLKYNNFNDAWLSFVNDKENTFRYKNNEKKYKNMFKKIYYKVKNDIWSPTQTVNFIKNEIKKIKKEVAIIG